MVTTWVFEPGHTSAEFRARHMMVSWVRGYIKPVHGRVHLDFERPTASSFEATMNAEDLWTGVADGDAHLRSADFFEVERHPLITFASTRVDAPQPPRLRRELAGPPAQGRRRRQRRGLGHPRCGGDPRTGRGGGWGVGGDRPGAGAGT